MPFAGERRLPPLAVLRKASALLLPYCAKPAGCAYRNREDCAECGACAVGEAYRLGRERGLEVTTIVNYEHLESTLARLRAKGAEAYIGLCCGQFFRKRYRAFQNAGLPALLLDIEGATCYALKREHEAYAGRFQAEARLDLDTLRRVLRHVPDGAAAADEAAFP
jgi:lipoate-protein ligase A